MGPQRRAIAAEVFAAGRDYDAAQSNRLNRLRNLEPETAEGHWPDDLGVSSPARRTPSGWTNLST